MVEGVPAMDLDQEGERATERLKGKSVNRITRHRLAEVLIEFTDGTRLFVDAKGALELSITGQVDDED